MTNTYQSLPAEEESIARQLVNIAFTIHKTLGPGLLESVYQKCFCHELKKRNIPFTRQQMVDILYDGIVLDEGLRNRYPGE